VLLDVWPTIKNAVPQAELHLFYGFKNWEYSAQFNPKQQETIASLKEQINSLQKLDVYFHDRVDQVTLAKELLSSGVWTYPTFFTETSCITAMEMQAAGVRMVTSNIAALTETVGNRGVLLDGDWTSAEYKNKFIAAVVEKLTHEDESDRKELQEYARLNFDLDQLALDWEDMFYSLLKEITTNPLVPYFPTRPYLSRSSFHSAPFSLLNTDNLVKLNIGAGPNIFPFDGWINYDRVYFSEYFQQLTMVAKDVNLPENERHPNTISWMKNITSRQGKLIDYLSRGGSIEYRIGDVQYPFDMHPDNSVDIIYLGQMIEHLNPIYVIPKLLAECYRMLKPGGTLRITTPDLDLLIQAYLNNDLDKFSNEQPLFYKEADPSEQLAYIMYGACGPNCSWNNYEGHMFLFTKNSMRKALKNVGFEKIKFFNSGHLSDHPVILQEVTDEGVSHSLLVEAIK
jgi:predicted SAM-dependent methyltransferase